MRFHLIALVLIVAACAGTQALDQDLIPLNLDFSRAGLVDEQLPWGWSFQGLTWSSMTVEADPASGELFLAREGEGSVGRAIYDLNSPFAGRRLRFEGSVERDDGSSASLRLGILALDEERDLTETLSPWSEAGRLTVELEAPSDSWNTQLAVEYRGSGAIRLGLLALAIDGEVAGHVLPDQPLTDPEAVAWIRDHAIALSTADDEAPLADLDALASVIGDTPLVLLGESTHGTAEFFDMKTRLLKWLALRGEPVVFVIEDHADKAARIDRFIHTGEGDARSVVRGLFGFWRRQEVVDLVQWMREATAVGAVAVTFAGVDCQVPLGAIAAMEASARELDPALARTLSAQIAPMREAWEEQWYPRREAQVYRQWLTAAQGIEELLRAAGASEKLRFQARLVRQSAEISTSDDMRLRDRFMAENLAWLRERAPDARFVFWAHNTHVRIDEEAAGQHLEARYPGEVLSVGLFTHRGEYTGYDGSEMRSYTLFEAPAGSLEGLLHRAGPPMFALDLRPLRRFDSQHPLKRPWLHRNIGLWPQDLGFYRTVVPDGFDALIYIDTTHATRPLPSE